MLSIHSLTVLRADVPGVVVAALSFEKLVWVSRGAVSNRSTRLLLLLILLLIVLLLVHNY